MFAIFFAVLLLCTSALLPIPSTSATSSSSSDWRALYSGEVMMVDNYLDQPYVVVIPHPTNPSHSRWIVTITRNSLPEGNRGEHVEMMYSDDAGGSWSTPVKLEPGAGTVEGLTNAYSTVIMTTYGRVYVTYNLNLGNVTHFPDGKPFTRDDTQGSYVMRWSDDSGLTWSSERVTLPYRHTAIDRHNVPFNGSTVMFWSVDQYKSHPDGDTDTVFLGLTKVGTYAYAPPEESWLWSSPNLRTERNISAIIWNMLPSGDVGIASVPAKSIIEETHIMPLSAVGGGGSLQSSELTSITLVQQQQVTQLGQRGGVRHTLLPSGMQRPLQQLSLHS